MYHTITLISHTSKVTLKILQARPQEYVNWELPDVQARFRKGRRARDQIANIRWIKRIPDNIYFCLTDYIKAFECVDCNKLWETLQEMGQPDHLTCLLRNLHSGQEATEPDMEQRTDSKLRKEYVKAVYCHPVSLTYMQSTSNKTRKQAFVETLKINGTLFAGQERHRQNFCIILYV